MTTHGKKNLPVFQQRRRYAFRSTEEALVEMRNSKIQTASILVGTEACNARCAFCVSKMTPSNNMPWKKHDVDWNRFMGFMQYAQAGRAEAIMLTGKGEPTLFPDEITDYLEKIQEAQKALGFTVGAVELQSNGIRIIQRNEMFAPLLPQWATLGLTTIAISIVHYDPEINRQTYSPHKTHYIDLPKLIEVIHAAGIRVRLACIVFNGALDSAEKLQRLMAFARENGVEELTVRPVNQPDNSRNEEVSQWISGHRLTREQQAVIENFLRAHGSLEKVLPHGALIFNVGGQNVCLTNSLTPVIQDDNHTYYRQLIFYPTSRIITDWTEEGEELP